MERKQKIILGFFFFVVVFMIYFVSAQTTFNEGIWQYQEPQISEEEDECKRLGFCWKDNKCYPLGYIKEGQYCGEIYNEIARSNFPEFVEQSNTGEFCINSYECKTNICSDNSCVNLTKENNEKSQEEIDCNRRGCFEEGKCHLFGYIKSTRYCDESGIIFDLQQSNEGESCNDNYGCKTNLCSDGICINSTKQEKEIESLKIENEKFKKKLNELENISSETKLIVEEENKNIFKKIVNFFKLLFKV